MAKYIKLTSSTNQVMETQERRLLYSRSEIKQIFFLLIGKNYLIFKAMKHVSVATHNYFQSRIYISSSQKYLSLHK